MEHGIPLLIVGYDYRIASSAMREKLIMGREEREQLFQLLRNHDSSCGFFALETCNRMELVASTLEPKWISENLAAWMYSRLKNNFPEHANLPVPYIYTGKDAVIHALKVVAGMESLAVGEAQIAGQFNTALLRAQEEKTSTPLLNQLGHIAGRTAKTGYKIGFRSNYRQGIHGLVVKFLNNFFENGLEDKTIIIAGMGEIGRKTAGLMEDNSLCSLIKLNRTIKSRHAKTWVDMNHLPGLSKDAHALVVATGAPEPIIGVPQLALKNRKTKLLILDIGVPHQVEPAVQTHENVSYHNIDDLLYLGRDAKNDKKWLLLECLIENEFNRFQKCCQAREFSHVLSGIDRGKSKIMEERVPELIGSLLMELDAGKRKQVEDAIKKVINEYSHDIFCSVFGALDRSPHEKS